MKERPRLSERCLPRLRFDRGRCRVVLFDGETGDGADVGPREWTLLAAMDGTRDREGLLLAARREGVDVSDTKLDAVLRSLDEAGFLEEGIAPKRAPRATEPETTTPPNRPIEMLEGYRFHCTGRGTCCRMYPTIVFSPRERATARALLPMVLEAGDRSAHAFTPERGAGPCSGAAIAHVDGGCAYLEGDLCALHRAGGAGAKPFGCGAFPLELVDDGVAVRASVAIECACVLASLDDPRGEPLLPPHVTTRADLDPRAAIRRMPEAITVAAKSETGERFRAWSDAVRASLRAEKELDAPRTAWALADTIVLSGLDVSAWEARLRAPTTGADLASIGREVASLRAAVEHRWENARTWRADTDVALRGMVAMLGAADILGDADVLGAVVAGAGARANDERFYLDAALFGRELAFGDVERGIRARAVAMWIARVVPLAASAAFGDAGNAFDHPLAIVEALLRAHGIRALAEQDPSRRRG